jgi:murein DD-endopeptidase MepM/ murein hydrolase activator NlpD
MKPIHREPHSNSEVARLAAGPPGLLIQRIGALLVMLLSSCAAPTTSATPLPFLAPTSSPTHTLPPTATPALPSLTPTPVPSTPTSHPPTPTPTPGPQLCSPLEDVALAELPGMIAGNVFQTPMPGRDSGHPGIDLAFYSHGARKTMLGLPLKAAMAGRVAAVLPDRYPYGNALILEVPLDQVPGHWLANLNWPGAEQTVVPNERLTCPTPLSLPQWDLKKRSLYLMYGHLNQPSPLKAGESVNCGQTIGEAGTTGASVNPHLHFEARLGPANATFKSIGHYDTHTTTEERNNYCVWRVSGWFQVVDPLKILEQQP